MAQGFARAWPSSGRSLVCVRSEKSWATFGSSRSLDSGVPKMHADAYLFLLLKAAELS